MKTNYKIIQHSSYIEIKFEKTKTFSPEGIYEVLRKENQLFSREHINTLWDFRKCTDIAGFDHDSVLKIINYIENSSELIWSRRVAILIETYRQAEISEMYLLFSKEYPTFTEIFIDEDSAREWLRNQE